MQTTFSPYRVLLSGALLLTALFSTFVLLGVMTHPTQAAMPTSVGGPITTNTTWTAANSPYILTETVEIVAGVTLTVEPGVTVMGQSNTAVFAYGRLQAIGTPENPITFTAENNTPGGWDGIGVGESATLKHVVINQANLGLDLWDSEGEGVLMEDSVISSSAGWASRVALPVLHRLQMFNVSFVNNAKNRVLVEAAGDDDFLTDNATLTPQPGLEGYEFQSGSSIIEVPQGITLTVEPGTTLLFSNESLVIQVFGHLEAVGTADSPITFTGVPEGPPTDGWDGIDVVSSANFNYVTIDKADWSLGMGGTENGHVLIENSTISNSSYYPLIVQLKALHRLQMSNVSFVNNAKSRVLIDVGSDENLLTNNVTLTPQPGLEGYEVYDHGLLFIIESGVTLTLEPGVTFMSPMEIAVNGHLEAVGTETNPVIFTSPSDSPSDDWFGIVAWDGTTHLTHTIVRNACLGLGITEFSGPQVLENSVISESTCVAIYVASSALHQLHMSNVTFSNNVLNRVRIDNSYQNFLIADVTLSSQPGLEGYEVHQHFSADGTLIVPEGITLTLQSGTTLMMYDDESLKVSGELKSMGTPQNPITFTSATNSAAGEWAGIVVSGTADFAHTTVRYAQTGVTVAGGAVSAVCSTFTDNLLDGVYVDSTGSPTVNLSASGIFGNGGWNLFNNNSTQVDARYNWWGSPSDPASTISGNILYTPWLTEPTCPAPPPPPPVYHLYLPLVLIP